MFSFNKSATANVNPANFVDATLAQPRQFSELSFGKRLGVSSSIGALMGGTGVGVYKGVGKLMTKAPVVVIEDAPAVVAELSRTNVTAVLVAAAPVIAAVAAASAVGYGAWKGVKFVLGRRVVATVPATDVQPATPAHAQHAAEAAA